MCRGLRLFEEGVVFFLGGGKVYFYNCYNFFGKEVVGFYDMKLISGEKFMWFVF